MHALDHLVVLRPSPLLWSCDRSVMCTLHWQSSCHPLLPSPLSSSSHFFCFTPLCSSSLSPSSRSMLQSEVDSLRSQLGGGGRINPSAAEMQLQQMNQALTQSHRDREELLAYITKISQQRVTQESNVMNDHSRGRFNDSQNNGNYQHQHQQQQISSSNGESKVPVLQLL